MEMGLILDGYIVTLDHRNLRTPGGTKLVIPKEKRVMAMLIANEWENQDEVLKQHALPLVRFHLRYWVLTFLRRQV